MSGADPDFRARSGLSIEAYNDLADAVGEIVGQAVTEHVPTRLAGGDATLWGPAAEPGARIRLGWLDLPRASRGLLDRLSALRAELTAEGIDRIVLAGMGGSSLAPEVICRTAGVDLTVLDTTDPGQVRAALADRLDRTLVVVSSKSGTTVETDSHRRVFAQAFADAGLPAGQVGRRFVVVTDPGSPLEQVAEGGGYREVFLADPDVGGRYSALSAFGLVPAALAGADVASLLDDAEALSAALPNDSANPGLDLGAALGAAFTRGRDKIVIADVGSGLVGLGDWAEQLIAESTGKDGRGLLPVVVESCDAPGSRGQDTFLITIGSSVDGGGATVSGPLGAQFLVWEYATALAGRVIGIDPFDQPNVAESKDNTRRILADGLPEAAPVFTDGAVQVFGDPGLLGDIRTVAGVLRALLDAIGDRGYLAVMAYLDRHADASAADLRTLLARATPHPVTFGWGPRFLHSTGQYHKGGPQVGAFLQITGAVAEDLRIPGVPYTFGQLQAAQSAGDLQALAGRGRPVARLHLTDRAAGLGQLLEAVV
ncbi:MAG TPA: glucose-6-phosphate isomerase [Mycobacteriales bacterium]|nr:glucose-6-phosphate isomerase [Mycobacteriales bacterium]